MSSLGGLTTHWAQEIRRKWFPSSGTWSIYAEREATLTPDMSAIDSRRFRCVRVMSDRDGIPELRLDWEEARWLADALTQACDETRGERGTNTERGDDL